MADGQGNPVKPGDLAGTATLSAVLEPDGAQPIPLLVSVPKTDIGKPVNADLTTVKPGHATLRMSLTITTAAATDRSGAQIAREPRSRPKTSRCRSRFCPSGATHPAGGSTLAPWWAPGARPAHSPSPAGMRLDRRFRQGQHHRRPRGIGPPASPPRPMRRKPV
ncbi:hypothetical protein BZL30_9408 [Mycobacterium kansasii]|uniref:Uncharacterized protein n=1 Tax=Mycobacterium kansasii TaxID=1768 RepID=A0A1V3WBV1_MYCKA|nr:hypothetical protein BZL30_9408 [Mycobacterium kansasii]